MLAWQFEKIKFWNLTIPVGCRLLCFEAEKGMESACPHPEKILDQSVWKVGAHHVLLELSCRVGPFFYQKDEARMLLMRNVMKIISPKMTIEVFYISRPYFFYFEILKNIIHILLFIYYSHKFTT